MANLPAAGRALADLAKVPALVVRARERGTAAEDVLWRRNGGGCDPVLDFRFSSESVVLGEDRGAGCDKSGTERVLLKDVNRGRM